MIEFSDQVNLQAEIIAAKTFLNNFGSDINTEENPNASNTLQKTISEAEKSLDFRRSLQEIQDALDNPRQELFFNDEKKARFYHLQLRSCIKNEEARWKKNALIIALFCTIFFAAWIYLNTLLFLCLPPALFFPGFQIILALNFFLIKGLKIVNAHKDSLETEFFYNHVTFYKEIAVILEDLSFKYYNPAADLDEKTKRNLRKLMAIAADILHPQNSTEIIQATKNIYDHKRYLAQIIAFLLHDSETKPYLWIFNNPISCFFLDKIFNHISKEEDKEKAEERAKENKTYLLSVLQIFAQETGDDFEELKSIFENQRWYELFDKISLKA